MEHANAISCGYLSLNESPSEKEGKLGPAWIQEVTNCFPQ